MEDYDLRSYDAGYDAGYADAERSYTVHRRLAELRRRIEAEDISYEEIAELQDLARTHRAAFDGDMLLLEWAGVAEAEAH